MMTYELAKQLKDAGFPFERWCDDFFIEYATNHSPDCFPTLSELIEACGYKFGSLQQTGNAGWLARAGNVVSLGDEFVTDIFSTPEEAVAELWLALNK